MGMSNTFDVAVVGGGVTGLASALRLVSLAPRASVALIDSGPRLGGKVCGEVIENCVVDGGPDLCVESKLARTHAYRQLGIGHALIPVNPAGLPTFRRSGGELSPFPRVVTEGLVTMPGGMHELARMMMSAMPQVRARVGVQVVSIERSRALWTLRMSDGSAMTTSALVCALPATAAAPLFKKASPPLARAAATISYLPLTTVSAAWARRHVPEDLLGTGFVEAEPREGDLTACTWTTSKIPMRSSYDVVMLRGYVRSADVDRATKVALGEMAGSIGVRERPLWTRAYSWVDAMPLYPQDHRAAVTDLRCALKSLPELAFAGAAWDGPGIGDCISSGETAAEAVAAALRLACPT